MLGDLGISLLKLLAICLFSAMMTLSSLPISAWALLKLGNCTDIIYLTRSKLFLAIQILSLSAPFKSLGGEIVLLAQSRKLISGFDIAVSYWEWKMRFIGPESLSICSSTIIFITNSYGDAFGIKDCGKVD